MPISAHARDTTHYKAVDAWIAKDLTSRYNDILCEALPPDLLDLLQE